MTQNTGMDEDNIKFIIYQENEDMDNINVFKVQIHKKISNALKSYSFYMKDTWLCGFPRFDHFKHFLV